MWKLYQHRYVVLSHGAFPAHDTVWQYPPGTGVVLLSPALPPWPTYSQSSAALTLAHLSLALPAIAGAVLLWRARARLWTGPHRTTPR